MAVVGLLDPEVEAVWMALEAVAWLTKYLPDIESYLDAPRSLDELQRLAGQPQYGYEIHHIVEAQFRSRNEQRNSLRFSDRINSPDNLARIPHWEHVLISSWYSRKNDFYGGVTPRNYLRGKDWIEQYNLGLQVLRDFGVLK